MRSPLSTCCSDRDGTTWHFDDGGRLVLVETEGTATRYVREAGGRIAQIVGYVGKDAVAEIRLSHDQCGRIVAASTRQAVPLRQQAPVLISALSFEYNEHGRLVKVNREEASKLVDAVGFDN